MAERVAQEETGLTVNPPRPRLEVRRRGDGKRQQAVDSFENNNNARETILQSIRSHLAASLPHDARESHVHHASVPTAAVVSSPTEGSASQVELFKSSLEAVDGYCIVAQSELEIVRVLTKIIGDLQRTHLHGKRIALSDSPVVARLLNLIAVELDELAVTPSATDVFSFDVGVSTVQAGIAETGTLLLDSSRERHRLVSLVPPVHIAIVEASQIYQTLAEALAFLRRDEQVSPIVTLVTGPSRTADIELTLAIGVHGPQELYVVINEGPPLAN
jgi:L-lactate dehydrogenase complex protein LldG